MTGNLQITIVEDARDTEGWDDFLLSRPGSDILQSSLWAQLKATVGWGTLRLIIRRGDNIVGGAQILTRALPSLAGSVGYVPRGPVLACREPDTVQLTIDHLREAARRKRLQMLIVQAPLEHEPLHCALGASGFQPSTTNIAPAATMRIDLSQEPDAILAHMKSSTRYNVRRSQREGIEVRQGFAGDLKLFSKLHKASSKRQGFSTYSEEYFENMWKIFAPSRHIQLLISEYNDEPVSALLVVAFGDTVWAKRFGWSGEHSRRMPNEALIWRAFNWAKAAGYRYFDQDGVARRAAEALLDDRPVPDSVKKTPSYFKLGFGGQPVLFPETQAYIYNPAIRFAYQTVLPKVARKSTRKKLVNLLRLG